MKKFALFKKVVACFFLITLLNNLFFPFYSLALTAGPTSPDASSFEPVDTTDMVNLLTGDLVYNLPLLDIPGPEGSYPLSLSYHSGITPGLEASWAGLGFTLNPGAINRSVNGFPDDFSGQTNITRNYASPLIARDFGVSLSLALGPVSVTGGVDFAYQTYKGYGTGWFVGGGFNIPNGGIQEDNLGIQGYVGQGPYGNWYGGVGVSVSNIKDLGGVGVAGFAGSVGAGITFSQGHVGVSASVGVSERGSSSFPSSSLLGATYSTLRNRSNFSIAGGAVGIRSTIQNQKGWSPQIINKSWNASIPFLIGNINISYRYFRIWVDNSTSTLVNGSLYGTPPPPMVTQNEHDVAYEKNAFDNYQLLDPIHDNIVDSPDPLDQVGGTLPDYDTYSVSAQGVGGYMRPYGFQMPLYNNTNIDKNIFCVTPSFNPSNRYPSPSVMGFRFVHDFSNSFTQNIDSISPASGVVFDTHPYYGGAFGYQGYNPGPYGNQLAGSRNISYFTNADIVGGAAKTKGFLDVQAPGFSRPTTAEFSKQIGGFKVTNESGVTYHYSLPAYEYGDSSYTVKYGRRDIHSTLTNKNHYAYIWLLTAVTGPDYVDVNNNGMVDSGDWGYWVAFDYGKWTSNYYWRNPATGFENDLDSKFGNVSMGDKEVYYLDAIRTRTHTAIFAKANRADVKSVLVNGQGFQPDGKGNYPVSSMRLSNIYLFNNNSLPDSLAQIRQGSVNTNIIDVNAMNTLFASNLRVQGSIQKEIDFSQDYSLCPNTENSYNVPGSLLGKLTLNAVSFKGKGGVKMLPDVRFSYELPAVAVNQDQISIPTLPNTKNHTGVIFEQGNNFKTGDIIKFNYNGGTYYCTLLSQQGGSGTNPVYYNVMFLGVTPTFTIGSLVTASKTKNPPYYQRAFDIWGSYKSDYDSTQYEPGSKTIHLNDNSARAVTAVSAMNKDVWTLRSVQTSVGGTINFGYSSDVYSKAAFKSDYGGRLTNCSVSGDCLTNGTTVTATVSVPGQASTDQFYTPGQVVNVILFLKQHNKSLGCEDTRFDAYKQQKGAATVISVNSATNTLVLSCPFLAVNSFPINPSSFSYKPLYGNISLANNVETYGGDVRVENLSFSDPFSGVTKKTVYNYSNPSTMRSSGVTSFVPNSLEYVNFLGLDGFDSVYAVFEEKFYKELLYQDISSILANSRLLPPPGVNYEYVSESDEVSHSGDATTRLYPSKVQYRFKVLSSGMEGIKELQYGVRDAFPPILPSDGLLPPSAVRYSNKRLQDFTAWIGCLRSVTNYDDAGRKLSEVNNHYLFDDLTDTSYAGVSTNYPSLTSKYNYQGLTMERFAEGRFAPSASSATGYFGNLVMTQHEEYPNILEKSVTTDYKHGTTEETDNLAYDFYGGQVTRTLSTDPYGNRFLTVDTPAYRIYDVMGLGFLVPARRNMLSQSAGTKVYSVDASNKPIGIISATVQSWSIGIPIIDIYGNPINLVSEQSIYRKDATYEWRSVTAFPNGITPLTGAGAFVDWFGFGAGNPSWVQTGLVTKADVYSKEVEVKDINGNYATSKLGFSDTKVLATGAPAKFAEIQYSGAEEDVQSTGYFPGSLLTAGDGRINSSVAHTGSSSLYVYPRASGFTGTLPISSLNAQRSYKISAWVSAGSDFALPSANLYYKVNPSGMTVNIPPGAYTSKKSGKWYLVNLVIPAASLSGATSVTIGCQNIGPNGLYVDDFRFQPIDATTSSYVYDPVSGELTYSLDNNNLFTHYEYDFAGRLTRTSREFLGVGPKVIGENQYHYKGQ